MQIISGTTEFTIQKRAAVAIGKFDGVHLGHKKLLSEIIRQKKKGLKAAVFTFDPSPEAFFGRISARELSTKEEKRARFKEIGIDILVEFPFNRETAATSPEKFVTDILLGRMNAAFVAAGSDLSFGARGKGNFELMSKLADEYGFEAKRIHKIEKKGKVISSTLIRGLVESGKMEDAAEYLGVPYSIFGTIVHGRALGRKIGIPTLNQIPPVNKLLPPFGVYYSEVLVNGKTYKGMTNIGIKPTVTDEAAVTAETYLYNFSGDLYGWDADTRLLTFRRPEQHFDSIKTLKKKMEEDVKAGARYHGLGDHFMK